MIAIVPDLPDEDPAPHHRLGLRVTLLCVLLMAVEGLDTNAISYISPLLREELDISVKMVGVIYSVTVFASLGGAVLLAPVSDRIGRRPVMIVSSFVMGLCSLATPLAATLPALLGLRLLIGLAFGAAVPVTFALVAEFTPPRRRAMSIMIVSSGVGIGYILAGLLAAAIVPLWGWRVLMLGVGAASLCTVAAALLLPESPAFVARRSGDPALAADGAAESKPGPLALWRPPFLSMTALIWIAVLSIYVVEFLLGYWLPTLLIDQGYSLRAAGVITAVGKIGGICGSLLIGWLMDRQGKRRVLATGFALGALSLLVLPLMLGGPALALAGVLGSSFLLSGTFSGSQALTVTSYPPSMRATASGWISGLSRFLGGGAGALAGGWLIGEGYGAFAVCLLMAACMAVGCCAIVVLERAARRRPAGASRTFWPLPGRA